MDGRLAVAWQLHARRQAEVHRGNLLAALSYCVKALIDQSCFKPIDDNNYSLHNFCAVLEQILSHRLKPQISFFSGSEMPTFWDYIRVACKDVPHNCLASIEAMENLETGLGKGRAWIRMALLEKRLAEYLRISLSNKNVTRQFYESSAILRTEEGGTVTMLIQGLNAIDFSLCLRDGSFDVGKFIEVDYTPFLSFSQSDAGRAADAAEERVVAMESSGHRVSDNDIALTMRRSLNNVDGNDAVARVFELEQQLGKEREQKSFFEEWLRNRESQLTDYKQQVEDLKSRLNAVQEEATQERRQYQAIILELQQQASVLPSMRGLPIMSPQNLAYSIQYDNSPSSSPPTSPAAVASNNSIGEKVKVTGDGKTFNDESLLTET